MRVSGRRRVYEEARRMVPGSIYVPRLPNDPTRSSYCIGNVVVPPWTKLYDLSSDDPEKWDSYKRALDALRKTFNEFRSDPETVKNILGLQPTELPPLSELNVYDAEDSEEAVDRVNVNMHQNLDMLSGMGSLEKCIIRPAGQGVPDMANLVVDPSTPRPQAGVITDSVNSFSDIDTGPAILKKQKLTNQEPNVVGNPEAMPGLFLDYARPYFLQKSVPENKPKIWVAPQLPESIPQVPGRDMTQQFFKSFPFTPNLQFQSAPQYQMQSYPPYNPQLQSTYNPPFQALNNPQLGSQYFPQFQFQPIQQFQAIPQPVVEKQPNPPNKGINAQSQGSGTSGLNKEKLLELEYIVSRYSKGATKKKFESEILGRRAGEKKQEFEPDRNQIRQEIKDRFQNIPPKVLDQIREDQLNRIRVGPRKQDIPVRPNTNLLPTNQVGVDNPPPYNPSQYEQNFLSSISNVKWNPDDFSMVPPRYLTEERQRNENLRSLQAQMMNPDPFGQMQGSLFGNNNPLRGNREQQAGSKVDFEALMKLFNQEDKDKQQK
ncbi:hypothetical protein TWF506_007323 [Arthrobotrys conoides]|uniref:Uncharacterized protein n=1 Tax=Arthrobotrys conoides TaxID=74498 RepID=A0AAN8RXX7_9PEZI